MPQKRRHRNRHRAYEKTRQQTTGGSLLSRQCVVPGAYGAIGALGVAMALRGAFLVADFRAAAR
ncbi:MAG: hypothetical protein ACYC42_05330, partial [Lysobacter sp.]